MKKLIAIAIALSVFTGFAVYQYFRSMENSLKSNTSAVIVATKQIIKNTIITSDMIEERKMPVDVVNALAVTSIDEVKGRIAKEGMEPGEQILTTRIVGPETKNDLLSYSIKEGYKAMTVKVDEFIGVAGFIAKGDRVDILGILAQNAIISQVVAENIEVLATGIKADTSGKQGKEETGADGMYTSVTLLVPNAELVKINYVLSEGKYRLVLRSALEKGTIAPSTYTP